MGAIGGFMLGGLLGSLLFGGLGAGAGIGLLDILLVAGGVFLLFKLMQGRRQSQPEPAYAGAGGWSGGNRPEAMQSSAVAEPSAADPDLDRGLACLDPVLEVVGVATALGVDVFAESEETDRRAGDVMPCDLLQHGT